MSPKTLCFAAILFSNLACAVSAFAAEPYEYISVQQFVNRSRANLPDRIDIYKWANDPVAFEVYNSSNRPISCTTLYIDTLAAPKGNCADDSKKVQVKFRFKNVNLWKGVRNTTTPDLWDVFSYWTPYTWNDLGINANFYDFGVEHPIIRERYDGGFALLAEAAKKLGMTVDDFEYCPVSPRVQATECYFGCFNYSRSFTEQPNQVCKITP